MMTKATMAVLVGGLCAVLLGPSAALAGFQPELVDFCFGTDHPPFTTPNPPPGLSVLLKADSLRRVPEGAIVEIVVTGPNGERSGVGTVDGTGRVLVPIGITATGPYTVKSATVTVTNPDGSETTQPIQEQVGEKFTVGGDDVPCTKEQLPEGEPLVDPPDEPVASTPSSEGIGSTVGPTQTRPQPTEGGGSDVPWPGILIGLGLPLIFGGLFIWLRPTKQCDWAAYYDDGGKLVPLRKAKGKECCRYVVKVTSTLNDYGYAAKGRQAPDLLDGVEEAPESRLRLFDSLLDFNGLDVESSASARSGPFGRLDWMQADTPSNVAQPTVTNESYRWQLRSHEEEPDVAIHLSYREQTDVTINLTSECPNHQNTYVANGTTRAFVQTNEECSNTEPGPECPVELTALSASRVSVWGDLAYSVDAPAGSDVDEVEGAGGLDVREVDGETFYGSHVDSHDHVTRARQTSQQTFTGNGTNTKLADGFSMVVHNVALLDAGSIIPARVWDTTDRVSADCFVTLGHDVAVDASMKRIDCDGGDCCGHGDCNCEPKLKLTFAGGGATIDCDGRQFSLDRTVFGFAMIFGGVGIPCPWTVK